jgi:hypothetical protein
MKNIITLVAAVPVLALFGGIGILALRIGETWNEAATRSLVTGLTVICGGGALIFAILLACIIGIPLAIRAYGESGASQRQWDSEPVSGRMALRNIREDWRALPSQPAKRQPGMIEGQWNQLQGPTPPWGMQGSTPTRLLPPAEQDERFGFDG